MHTVPCHIASFDVRAAQDRGVTGRRRTEERTMRFLMTTKPTDAAPDEKLFAEMGAFIEELTAAGVLLATGGLEPGGVRLVSSGDEITVTDGPYAEAKEAVA